MGKECSGQQTSWSYWQSFTLDSEGKRDVLLCKVFDREEPGNINALGSSREIIPVNYPYIRLLQEGSMANMAYSSAEVPLQQCTQSGK